MIDHNFKKKLIFQGKCLGQGTFDEMSTSGVDFSSLLKRGKEEEVNQEPDFYENPDNKPHPRNEANKIGSMMSLTSIGTEFEVRISI